MVKVDNFIYKFMSYFMLVFIIVEVGKSFSKHTCLPQLTLGNVNFTVTKSVENKIKALFMVKFGVKISLLCVNQGANGVP